jgi:hypothetical protein
MRNLYFSDNVRSEQNLYEDIVIEALKMYGQDVYYLPRDIVGEDKIFGDDVPSRFNSSYKVEMYIENIEAFEGEGDLFTRFGVEIRDEATFIVSRRRWSDTIKRYDNEITGNRPKEGDLIYLPLSKSLFQIMHVEHEQPFYQLANLPTYKMRCTLFEYSSEDLDTGVSDVDDIQADYDYRYSLTLTGGSYEPQIGDTAIQTFSDGVQISGEVVQWKDNIVHLVGVGADDGKYHTFVTDRTIAFGSDSSWSVSAISEENNISRNEQNEDFSTVTDNFLDFSEENPFGDPENN